MTVDNVVISVVEFASAVVVSGSSWPLVMVTLTTNININTFIVVQAENFFLTEVFSLLNIVRVVHAQSLAECLTVAHGVMTSHSLVCSLRAASSDHATELLLYTNICPDTQLHLPTLLPSSQNSLKLLLEILSENKRSRCGILSVLNDTIIM